MQRLIHQLLTNPSDWQGLIPKTMKHRAWVSSQSGL